MWFVASVAAYALAFVLLEPVLGLPIMAFGLVPAALAGWYLHIRGGVLAALTLIALTALLAHAVGTPDSLAAALSVPGGLVVLAAAVGSGVLRQRELLLRATEQRAQEKLHESEDLMEALGASEQRFRLLAEEALVGVYLIQDGVFQYVNQSLATTFGYEPVEVIGRLGPDDLTSPQDRPIVEANITARLEQGAGSVRYRFRGLRKDGSTVPVEVLGRALQVGQRPAILGTLRDRTKEADGERLQRLQLTALQAAPAGIVVTDPSGVIEWANPAVTELTGYPLEQLIGAHTRLFGSGRQPREFYETLWHTALSGGIWRGELVNRRKDGSEYREAMAITPVKDPDGEIEHFVAVKQDVSERYAAEESIRALNADLAVQLARITALHQIDVAITGGTSLEEALQAFVRSSRSGLAVDAAAVFVPTSDGLDLELMETLGFRNPPARLTLPGGQGVAGRAASTGRTHVVRGRDQVIEALSLDATPTFAEEDFEAMAAAPMLVRGVVRGALMVAHRAPLEVSTDWLKYLEGVATQGAILVDNTALLSDLRSSNEELRAAYDATIEGWSRALDLRDKETEGHSRRVTEITLRLAHAMGLPQEALVHVRRGALLHDIGKMGVPDAILQKPGKLSEQEWATMRLHTIFARDLLAPIGFLGPALDIPYSHHERWDGSGYPQRLEGEAIPLAARIFAVADVYDALTSDRPYRPAWSRERTLAHIRQGTGSHFDPAVVRAFLALQHDLAR